MATRVLPLPPPPATVVPPVQPPEVPAPTAAQIRRAEGQLKKAGFNPGKIDGKATSAFTAALKEFQKAWGLPATGQLDDKTTAKLGATAARVAAHAKKKDQFVSIGQKSNDIKTIERRLAKLGYDVGKIDGVYSQQTAKAVKAFRADQSNVPDGPGYLAKNARAVLAKESAALEHHAERRRHTPTAAQRRADVTTAQAAAKKDAAGMTGFGVGAKGAAVKNVQAHLAAAGFSPKHQNGVFDERTEGALKAFQRRSGLEATGRVTPQTWKALQKSLILSSKAAAPSQALYERSGAVKASETLLKKLGFNPGKIDGLFDKKTRNAVRAFEKQQGLKVDGVISAGELDKMKKLTKGVTLGQLHAIMPSLPMSKARQYLPFLNAAMAEAKINTRQRKAMFLAQIAHESVELRYFEEIASGAAYEGRTDLGNTHPGDGVRYKGRGPIQLTGRANYRAAGKALHLPLEAHPKMVATARVGFRTTAWFWSSHGLNQLADKGDFLGVTRRINGGTNGYDSRLRYYRRALKAL